MCRFLGEGRLTLASKLDRSPFFVLPSPAPLDDLRLLKPGKFRLEPRLGIDAESRRYRVQGHHSASNLLSRFALRTTEHVVDESMHGLDVDVTRLR